MTDKEYFPVSDELATQTKNKLLDALNDLPDIFTIRDESMKQMNQKLKTIQDKKMKNGVEYWKPETPAEKARRIGVPLIEPIKPYPGTNATIAVCGKCGLEIKQVMGYCCPNADCPCGMGPVTC